MKKAFISGLLIVGLLIGVAPMAMAGYFVQIGYSGSSYGAYQTGYGGEFTVKPGGGLEYVLNLYSSNTKNVGVTGTFQTFCLEGAETINGYASTYNVALSQTIIASHTTVGTPLTIGTAWLYHEFQLGTLAGYDYSDSGRYNGGTGPFHLDNELQKAIWMLQGEEGLAWDSNNKFIKDLITAGYTTQAAQQAANNWTIPVAVMNLTDNSGGRHQDLLVCYVPEPGSLILLGVGLLGTAALRRKYRKS